MLLDDGTMFAFSSENSSREDKPVLYARCNDVVDDDDEVSIYDDALSRKTSFVSTCCDLG